MSNLKTKLVSVECRRPIRLRNKFVRAVYREVLTVDEIADCIAQQATVREILPTGDTVILDFTNYNTDVIPSISEEEAAKAQAKAKKDVESKKKEKEVAPKVEEEQPTAAPVKEEEIVENAEEKVSEAKKATKEKK